MDAIQRRFLDYDGLTTLWNNINDKFADNSEAVNAISVTKDSNDVKLHYNYVDTNSDSVEITFPKASDDSAGIIDSTTYITIQNLRSGDPALVPFKGLNIDGNKLSVNGQSGIADIKLEYTPKGDKSYLSLVDSRFYGGSEWVEITEDVYNEATSNGGSPKDDYKYYSGKYLKWNPGTHNNKPATDNYGNPVLDIPKSEIDVTEFVKTGLLAGAKYEVKDGVSNIVLTFNVYKNGQTDTEELRIDVSDLTDIYEAGEGISIKPENTIGDTEQNISKISLNTSTIEKLGGIKIAKDNESYRVSSKTSDISNNIETNSTNSNRYRGVEIDSNDKAFVYVPWTDIKVNTQTLTLESDEPNLTSNIDLSESTKASLELANTSLQIIKVLNETITQDNPELTIDNAKKDLALGSASEVNITSDVNFSESNQKSNVTYRTIENNSFADKTHEKPTVPTTLAVKTYVDTKIENAINSLDSSIELPSLNYGIDASDDDVKYFKGNDIPYMFTNVSIEDGKLNKNSSSSVPISIYYIHDFAPITTAQINTICGITS